MANAKRVRYEAILSIGHVLNYKTDLKIGLEFSDGFSRNGKIMEHNAWT